MGRLLSYCRWTVDWPLLTGTFSLANCKVLMGTQRIVHNNFHCHYCNFQFFAGPFTRQNDRSFVLLIIGPCKRLFTYRTRGCRDSSHIWDQRPPYQIRRHHYYKSYKLPIGYRGITWSPICRDEPTVGKNFIWAKLVCSEPKFPQ